MSSINDKTDSGAEVIASGPATAIPASSASVWGVLGLSLMALLPFGGFGLLVLAMSLMLTAGRIQESSAVPVAVALFLLAGKDHSIPGRLWPSFRWGAGAALLAAVPYGVLTYLLAGDWMERNRFALLDLAAFINLGWLMIMAVVAWRAPRGRQYHGLLLGGVVATSQLMIGPVFIFGMLLEGVNDGAAVIMGPVLLAALAFAMMLVLLSGALIAWFAGMAGHRIAPRYLLAGVAGVLAALQIAQIIINASFGHVVQRQGSGDVHAGIGRVVAHAGSMQIC